MKKIRVHGLDFAAFLSLCLAGWIFSFGIESILDIGLYDESAYLYHGICVQAHQLPSAQSAPLYAIWYYILSIVQSDCILLYYLNYKMVTILPALLSFLTLRVYGVSVVISFIFSISVLLNASNFGVWPKVSHFTVIILLLGLIAAVFFKDKKAQTSAMAFFCLLASYVRPEFFIAFLLLMLLLVLLYSKAIYETKAFKYPSPLLFALISSIVLILSLGIPIGGNRSMIAFGQHYACNWVVWNHSAQNPWTNWESIVQQDFGDVSSPIQAVISNPAAIARHTFYNISRTPGGLKHLFHSNFPGGYPLRFSFIFFALVLIFALLPFANKVRIKSHVDRIRANFHRRRFLLFQVSLILFPVLLSIVLISPRGHYLLMLGALLATAGAILIFEQPALKKRESNYTLVALICATPLLFIRPAMDKQEVALQENLAVIQFLDSLNVKEKVTILEAEGGYHYYLGHNYTRVPEYSKQTGFLNFLTKEHINLIVVSQVLLQDTRFTNDEEWHDFINCPSVLGFVRIDMPMSSRYILVKKSLINSD